ncbi:MAG TPA: hypothetical protein VGS41_18085 [Chthonomonadales bacterium]|nr:hypothetical protein [Chthonomonadales bacterium]
MWVYIMTADQTKRRLLNLENGNYIDVGLNLGKPTIQVHFRTGMAEATTLAFCRDAAHAEQMIKALGAKLGACDMAEDSIPAMTA